MLTAIALIVGSIITYRLTQLAVVDVLFENLREFFRRRFPGEDFYYPGEYVREIASPEGHAWGVVDAFPFRRKVTWTGGLWRPDKTYTIAYLADCFYCASMWIAAGVTVLYTEYMGLPYTLETLIYFLTIAGGSELINNKLGRD